VVTNTAITLNVLRLLVMKTLKLSYLIAELFLAALTVIWPPSLWDSLCLVRADNVGHFWLRFPATLLEYVAGIHKGQPSHDCTLQIQNTDVIRPDLTAVECPFLLGWDPFVTGHFTHVDVVLQCVACRSSATIWHRFNTKLHFTGNTQNHTHKQAQINILN